MLSVVLLKQDKCDQGEKIWMGYFEQNLENIDLVQFYIKQSKSKTG